MRSICITLCVLSTVILGSCSSSKIKQRVEDLVHALKIVEHVDTRIPKDAPEPYRHALGLLDDTKYEAALNEFEAFTRNDPASPWTQAALLNSGRALEGLTRWSDAVARYREVVRGTMNARRLQTMALYRLSFCHEALGEDQQVVAALSDLLPRSAELPAEVGEAEMPARLAGAYARVGNFDRAIEFYQRAENGIARLRLAAGENVPEWLPRTLFYMGEMSRRTPTWADFETQLRPLARGQVYLLQASELASIPWSEKAADQLISIYEGFWKAIESPALPEGEEAVIAKRETQRKQWARATLLLDDISELRARLTPKELAKGSEPTKKLLAALNELEKKISTLLLERPAGEGLTREALDRKQKIGGAVVEPSDSLEKKFIASGRATKELKPIDKKIKRAKILPNKDKPAKTMATPSPTPAVEEAPVTDKPAPIRQESTPPAEDPNL